VPNDPRKLRSLRLRSVNYQGDALANCRVGRQHLHFRLEWDRRTMNVCDLAIKFTSYTHYILSREWAREGSHRQSLFDSMLGKYCL